LSNQSFAASVPGAQLAAPGPLRVCEAASLIVVSVTPISDASPASPPPPHAARAATSAAEKQQRGDSAMAGTLALGEVEQ